MKSCLPTRKNEKNKSSVNKPSDAVWGNLYGVFSVCKIAEIALRRGSGARGLGAIMEDVSSYKNRPVIPYPKRKFR